MAMLSTSGKDGDKFLNAALQLLDAPDNNSSRYRTSTTETPGRYTPTADVIRFGRLMKASGKGGITNIGQHWSAKLVEVVYGQLSYVDIESKDLDSDTDSRKRVIRLHQGCIRACNSSEDVFEISFAGGSRRLFKAEGVVERDAWVCAVTSATVSMDDDMSTFKDTPFKRFYERKRFSVSSLRSPFKHSPFKSRRHTRGRNDDPKRSSSESISNIMDDSQCDEELLMLLTDNSHPGPAAVYAQDIAKFSKIQSKLLSTHAEDTFRTTIRKLQNKEVEVQVPVSFVKNIYHKTSSGGHNDTNFRLAAEDGLSKEVLAATSGLSRSQVWKDLQRDKVQINGDVLCGRTGGAAVIVGTLVRHILVRAKGIRALQMKRMNRLHSDSVDQRVIEALEEVHSIQSQSRRGSEYDCSIGDSRRSDAMNFSNHGSSSADSPTPRSRKDLLFRSTSASASGHTRSMKDGILKEYSPQMVPYYAGGGRSEHSYRELDAHPFELSEANALACARDLLVMCNRTQSGGDTYFCIDAILAWCGQGKDMDNDRVCVLTPLDAEAAPLDIRVDVLFDDCEDELIAINGPISEIIGESVNIKGENVYAALETLGNVGHDDAGDDHDDSCTEACTEKSRESSATEIKKSSPVPGLSPHGNAEGETNGRATGSRDLQTPAGSNESLPHGEGAPIIAVANTCTDPMTPGPPPMSPCTKRTLQRVRSARPSNRKSEQFGEGNVSVRLAGALPSPSAVQSRSPFEENQSPQHTKQILRPISKSTDAIECVGPAADRSPRIQANNMSGVSVRNTNGLKIPQRKSAPSITGIPVEKYDPYTDLNGRMHIKVSLDIDDDVCDNEQTDTDSRANGCQGSQQQKQQDGFKNTPDICMNAVTDPPQETGLNGEERSSSAQKPSLRHAESVADANHCSGDGGGNFENGAPQEFQDDGMEGELEGSIRVAARSAASACHANDGTNHKVDSKPSAPTMVTGSCIHVASSSDTNLGGHVHTEGDLRTFKTPIVSPGGYLKYKQHLKDANSCSNPGTGDDVPHKVDNVASTPESNGDALKKVNTDVPVWGEKTATSGKLSSPLRSPQGEGKASVSKKASQSGKVAGDGDKAKPFRLFSSFKPKFNMSSRSDRTDKEERSDRSSSMKQSAKQSAKLSSSSDSADCVEASVHIINDHSDMEEYIGDDVDSSKKILFGSPRDAQGGTGDTKGGPSEGAGSSGKRFKIKGGMSNSVRSLASTLHIPLQSSKRENKQSSPKVTQSKDMRNGEREKENMNWGLMSASDKKSGSLQSVHSSLPSARSGSDYPSSNASGGGGGKRLGSIKTSNSPIESIFEGLKDDDEARGACIRVIVQAESRYRLCRADPQGDDDDLWATIVGKFTQAFYIEGDCGGRPTITDRLVSVKFESLYDEILG